LRKNGEGRNHCFHASAARAKAYQTPNRGVHNNCTHKLNHNLKQKQTKGLLYGMRLAKYPVIITKDADLENNPEHIPKLVQQISEFDIVVASRTKLPRISEKIASKTLGKLVGVTDTLSNFRAYRKEIVSEFNLKGGETFGAEFLVIAKKKGLAIGEVKYDPPPRRKNPRIGGTFKANLRIIWALLKSFTLYLI
jgi:dolichol-phosphate mannosyltransferase